MQTDELSPGWFKLHQSLQQAGMVCLMASFVVAMTLFHRKNAGGTLHKVYMAHFGMGIALPAAAVLQAILAAVRPALTSKYRMPWKAAHCFLGYGIVGLGKLMLPVGCLLKSAAVPGASKRRQPVRTLSDRVLDTHSSP